MGQFGSRDSGFFTNSQTTVCCQFITCCTINQCGVEVPDSGCCATVRCGANNCASGGYSATLGGRCNTSSGLYSAIVGGFCNIACGCNSFIGGGQCNTASGACSFIGGGSCQNTASGIASTIVAGLNNTACGLTSFVGGGCSNYAIADSSSIVGGVGNRACCQYSTTVGGLSNTANGNSSFIGGGSCNTASGCNSFLGGGLCNTASCNYSTLSGGCQNISSCFGSFIGGGKCNTASAPYSSVVGGEVNIAQGLSSFVGGGCLNTACGNCGSIGGGFKNNVSNSGSFIGGGQCNTASGYYSAILGGQLNNICGFTCAMIVGANICATQACTTFVNNLSVCSFNSCNGCNVCIGANGVICATAVPTPVTPSIIILGAGTCSTIRCGVCNTATCGYSAALSGQCNTASGCHSFVGGGITNTASGKCSVVSGGLCNTASGFYSFIGAGKNNTASGSNFGIIVGGQNNTSSAYFASTVIGGYCNLASGDYTFIGGGQYNSATGSTSTISGGYCNTANVCFSFVGGGKRNTASGVYSSILGGQCNNTCGFTCAMIVGANICATQACTTFVNDLSICSLTTGSVPFVGAAGLITQDNANLFWDDTNNRLGIGTATPLGILHLFVSAAATRMLLDGNAGQSKIITYRTNGLQRFGLYVNNTAESGSNVGSDFQIRAYNDVGTLLTTPLFIKRSSGNVGINTTTDAGYKLDVNGTGRFGGLLFVNHATSGNYAAAIYNTSATGEGLVVRGGSTSSHNAFVVQPYDGSVSLFSVLATGAATFSSSVNIGASATTGKQLIVNQTGASGYFLSGEASGTEIGYWYYDATTIQFSSKAAARALTFLTTDTERMRITSGGNVLIGTTTDTGQKLQIVGDVRATGTTQAPNFVSATGTAAIPYASYATFYTAASGQNAIYLVTLQLSGYTTYTAYATICQNDTVLVIMNQVNNDAGIQVSGLNIQGTNGSGITQSMVYKIINIS